MKFAKTTTFILIQLIICGMILEIVCSYFLLNTSLEKAPIITETKELRIHSREILPKEALKFLPLGPSSAFGWGVKNEETYSALVNSQFKTQGLNASRIGRSRVQGKIIWDKYFPQDNYPFSHVLIASGVNDLDKFRFFDSEPINDKIFFQAAPFELKMDKLHLPSNFAITLSVDIRGLAHEKLKITKSLEPDHINEQVIIFNTKLKSWALAYNLIFIDTFLLLQSSNTRENYYDPVNPSKIGYKKIAQQIINSLRK